MINLRVLLTLVVVLLMSSCQELQAKNDDLSRSKSVSSLGITQLDSKEKVETYRQENNLSKMSMTGELFIEIAEDYESHDHVTNYYIRSNGKNNKVSPLQDNIDGDSLSNYAGEIVSLDGFKQSGKNYGLIKEITKNSVRGVDPAITEKMLVLLVRFNDSTPPGRWPEDGRPILHKDTLAQHLNTRFFKTYFNQMFPGQYKNVVTRVEDWYTLDRDCDDRHFPGRPNNTCYMDTDELKAIVAERGIDHTQFDNVSVIISSKQWYNWGYATLSKSLVFSDGHRVSYAFSMVGSRRMGYGIATDHTPYLNPHNFMRVFLHERLHTWGFGHARGIDCGSSQVLFPCESQEYGNPYDSMGTGRWITATNADVLKRKGLRSESQYITISEPGTYEIDPLLSSKGDAILGAYIQSEFHTKPIYMLENRLGMGVDRELTKPEYSEVSNGLSIYTSMKNSNNGSNGGTLSFPMWGGSLRFMDARPSLLTDPPPKFYDRVVHDAISPNNPYFDPISGVEVRILNQGSTSRTGKVRFSVNFDESRRVCYKATPDQQAGKVYITKEFIEPGGSIGRRSSGSPTLVDTSRPVVLKPGDTFHLRVNTIQSNPSYCPRELVQISSVDATIFNGWEDTVGGCNTWGCGGGGLGDGAGDGSVGRGPGNDSDPQEDFSVSRSFQDRSKVNILTANTLTVPNSRDLPWGEHKIQFEYLSPRTGRKIVRDLVFVLKPF